tara:strand:+ start:12092 stop:12499 length:408 start_codon:yes stop_codon:yes gene_type:complete
MNIQEKKDIKSVVRTILLSLQKVLGKEYINARSMVTLINVITPLIRPLLEIKLNERKWGKDQGRDYSKEKKYNSSSKRKKYRAELNKENRKRGTYGAKDGKDLHHSGSGTFRRELSSTNKGRKEKSRTKGYNKKT